MMHRLALALLLLVLLTATGHALLAPEPPSTPAHLAMDAPAGWQLLPGLSKKLTDTALANEHFGSEPYTSAALAYGRANQGALYLTWVDSVRAMPSPEETLRSSFDALHQAPYLASPEAGSTQEISYRERSFDGVAEVSFEWAHMSNETVNIVRALGWKDHDARVHLAIAECVLPNDMVSESRPLCEAALASLRLSKADHEPLLALAAPAPSGPMVAEKFDVPELQTGEELPSDVAPSPSMRERPSAMGDVLYQGRPKNTAKESNRTVIAIGLALLALAIYLTTRSRKSDEASDDASDEASDDASDDASDEASGEASDDASDDASDEASGEASDDTSGHESEKRDV